MTNSQFIVMRVYYEFRSNVQKSKSVFSEMK